MKRNVFSLLDLVLLVVVVVVLLGIALPTLQSAREEARKNQCAGRLKSLALALHNYHDTYYSFPSASMHNNTQADFKSPVFGSRRLSGLTSLLPFMEKAALYERMYATRIHFNMNQDRSETEQSGSNLGPFAEQVELILCPSDDVANKKDENEQGRNNYRFCFGDVGIHSGGFSIYNAGKAIAPQRGYGIGQIDEFNRGTFAMFRWDGMQGLTDGTSNTILLSERCFGDNPQKTGQGIAVVPQAFLNVYSYPINADRGPEEDLQRCLWYEEREGQYSDAAFVLDWSGRRWGDGAYPYIGFSTVLPPNAPSCIANSAVEPGRAVIAPSSYHGGGVNVAMSDGRVGFVNEKIDWKTDLSTKENHSDTSFRMEGPSKFGVWGALGSRSGGESVAVSENVIFNTH